jgi:hypothetical protein
MTCLSTDTSIKSGGVKLVLWAQTSPLSEMTDAVMQVLFPYERRSRDSSVGRAEDWALREFKTACVNFIWNNGSHLVSEKQNIPHCWNSSKIQ